MADFENTPNIKKTNDTAGEAFEKFDDAGGVKAVGNALKSQYSPKLKRIGEDAGDWGKGVLNKLFHGSNKGNQEVKNVETSSNPVKTPPPKPSAGLPDTRESLLHSDSTDPKLNVTTGIPTAIQPEANSTWGHLKTNVSGTTVKTSINNGNDKYSVFGDPMSRKVGASWQNGSDRVQLSHNVSSGKNELSYNTSLPNSNFNASLWQKDASFGTTASYRQQIDSRSQIGANAAISKDSKEGVKAAASVMYTNKGPRKNVSLGAMASYEKGQPYMGVTGRITF